MITKLTLEYDGSDFAGWARQPDERTVQEELERVLRTILGDSATDGSPLKLSVAGRTDRGVHAWAQVASYAHEALDPLRLNGLLPEDISVLASEPAPESFDARRSASSRTYCYRVLARRTRSVFERRRAFWWTGPIDADVLHGCAQALLGRHDFTAFTPTETEHSRFVRDISRAEWMIEGELLRVLDRGRHLPAPYEPRARGHHARRLRGADPYGALSRSCLRVVRVHRREGPRPRTGWHWRQLRTTASLRLLLRSLRRIRGLPWPLRRRFLCRASGHCCP